MGKWAKGALQSLLLCLAVRAAWGEEGTSVPDDLGPQRPVPLFNRWQEDWSVLADPSVPHEPLDDLKYIPLSADPSFYLSLGAGLRERFESSDAPFFGLGGSPAEDYVISRLEADADLHLGSDWQIFVQPQSDYVFGKSQSQLIPVDEDRLSIEEAFIAYTRAVRGGRLKVRVGRQQFAFDLQRFVGVRDGPNVRQSYDAVWVDYETELWRLSGFASHPVNNPDNGSFDDYSSEHLTFSGIKLERKVATTGRLSFYYAHFKQDQSAFDGIVGHESRDIIDAHLAGDGRGFDWDLESMGQTGNLANRQVRAWAFGSVVGFTFEHLSDTPRLGIQIDAASGNHDPGGSVIGTFNPLFPNGYYVTLSGYTGDVNLLHAKASVTLHMLPDLKMMLAVAAQWRETTQDSVYAQPDIPLRDTAGEGGLYTATYAQFRADYVLNPNVSFALEMDQYQVADAIRQAGGHDSTYVGVESKLAW